MGKLSSTIIAFCLLSALLPTAAEGRRVLKVATFNNQYENNVRPWVGSGRRERVLRLIREEQFDVIGMQEPFWNQVKDLSDSLSGYGWVGNSTDGKIEDGYWHYNPIFYRKDRLQVLEWGRFWFSQTPDVPMSKGWDTHTSRFCVWAHFKDLKSGRDFFHFNVHYDHKGEGARQSSSRLLLEKISELAAGKPVFCTGDYNCIEGTPAYEILLGGGLKDSYLEAGVKTNDGIASWNDWKPMRMVDKPENFDHIFISAKTRALSWRMITTTYGGEYPSDHFPIVIEWKY